jgi:hypothetical protein
MTKQPKIAIYYDNGFGRNDGPPLYWFNAMRSMGLDVKHLLPEGDISRQGTFDIHVWVDWGEDGLPWQEWYPPKDGGKTVYVASDTHLDNGYRYVKANRFDYVFFNQKKAVESWQTNTSREAMWLPHAAEPQAYPHFEITKKYDVAFIGHLSDEPNVHGMSRVETLDRLFKAYPNFYFGTRNPAHPGKNMFEDAAKRFCQSRIVINHSVRDDGLNMRFFEALSTGSFLLTSRTPDAEALGFIDGLHYASYDSYEMLLEKVAHYLANENEREQLAYNGRRHLLEAHTYQYRVRTMLETLGYDVDLLINPTAKPDNGSNHAKRSKHQTRPSKSRRDRP